jgi:type II secretory pathway pseudopilin PulG
MKYQVKRSPQEAAFSIAELMVACGILAIAAAAAIGSLVRMNHNAALSRLQTGASTIVQERIDHILEDGPFNLRKNQIPDMLVVGTQTIGTEANPTIPIYSDPATKEVMVLGWLTSTVTETNRAYGPWSVKVRNADVTVGYKFRGKPYTVRMCTVRSPDA